MNTFINCHVRQTWWAPLVCHWRRDCHSSEENWGPERGSIAQGLKASECSVRVWTQVSPNPTSIQYYRGSSHQSGHLLNPNWNGKQKGGPYNKAVEMQFQEGLIQQLKCRHQRFAFFCSHSAVLLSFFFDSIFVPSQHSSRFSRGSRLHITLLLIKGRGRWAVVALAEREESSSTFPEILANMFSHLWLWGQMPNPEVSMWVPRGWLLHTEKTTYGYFKI